VLAAEVAVTRETCERRGAVATRWQSAAAVNREAEAGV